MKNKKSGQGHLLQFVVLSLLIIFIPFPARGQFFTKISTAGGAVTDSVPTGSACWNDFNNDGWIDIAIGDFASTANSNRLYFNQGNGMYQEAAGFYNSFGGTTAPIAADFDNDGDVDLFCATYRTASGTAAPNILLQNSGAPDYLLEELETGIATSVSPSASWVDYDSDGDVDLFIQGAANTNDLFYQNEGNGQFTKIDTLAFLKFRSQPGGHDVWIDYDGDGDQDLYAVNPNVSNDFYKNMLAETGVTGYFVKINTSGITSGGGYDIGASWADYDNDGDFDLYINKTGSFAGNGVADLFYKNNGDGTFTLLTNLITTTLGNTSFGAWGDYDNDGDLDLYVAHVGTLTTPAYLFRNDGNDAFSIVSASEAGDAVGPLLAPQAGNWSDYDNDGDLDLYVVNYRQPNNNSGAPQPNFLFRNEIGNQNNWLKIKLEGVESNKLGIGARVKVFATINGKAVVQTRWVNGGTTSHAFQADLKLHFGLGEATIVDSVKIFWPSGNADLCTAISVNQLITITEGDCLVSAINQLSAGETFRFYSPSPNPSSGSISVVVETTKKEIAEIDILDARGFSIKKLHQGDLFPGRYVFQWENTGVAAGIYFLRAKTKHGESTKKIIVVK